MNEPQFNDPRLPDHFWAKVSVAETGCWEWRASTRRRGYGRYGGAGNQRAAHRVAYEALVGPIPEGLQLDHLCFVTCCVNPAHLEPVTQQENIRRKKPQPKNSCKNGHPYTPENTYWNANSQSRVCRTCQNATWTRQYYARRGISAPPAPEEKEAVTEYEKRVPTSEAEAIDILEGAALVMFGQILSYRGGKNSAGERYKGWNGQYVDHVKSEADGALAWLKARSPTPPTGVTNGR